MSKFFQRLRALLKQVFFWHGDDARSREFTPEPAHDHALVLQVTKPPSMPRWRQLRYAARVLTLQERRLVGSMALLFLLSLVLGAWFVVKPRLLSIPSAGGRVVEAVVGAPKYPNPFYAVTNDPDQDLVALIYSGLFRRTDGSNVVPDLVERFTWSDDGKILTLMLRDDARFHDGVPVVADDVVFTINAAKDPAWKSSYQNALRNLRAEATDARTVTITLTKPDVTVLDTLTLGILPAHIWQDVPPGSAHLANANVHPVGSGPFRARSFLHDGHGAVIAYTLERNDRYYGLKPLIDQLELRFYPDHQSAEEALRAGQVDALAFVPGPTRESLVKHERLTASTIELPQETITFFNVNDAILKDAKIRQALALTVERDDVVEAQAGIASPISSPFPFETFVSATSTPEERLEQGRKLLDQAGWVIPTDGDIRIKKPAAPTPAKTTSKTTGKTTTPAAATSTTPLTSASSTKLVLTITVPDVPDLIAVADALQRRWSLLGIKMEVAVKDPDILAREVTSSRNAQILVWNILLSPSQDQYPIWWSAEATGRGLNLSNLSDRNVDDAIEGIRAATTTQMLTQARATFTQTVLNRTPAIFLTRPGYGYVHSSRLKGMSPVLQLGKPSDRFLDVTHWYVNSGLRWR